MYTKLSKQYGVSVLSKELPNSVFGFYTYINDKGFVVVNNNFNYSFQKFCAVALTYFHINGKQINMLTTTYEKDCQQLSAIEFAKDFILNEG